MTLLEFRLNDFLYITIAMNTLKPRQRRGDAAGLSGRRVVFLSNRGSHFILG